MSAKVLLWKSLGEKYGYPPKGTSGYADKVEEYRNELARMSPDIELPIPEQYKPAPQAPYTCERCGHCSTVNRSIKMNALPDYGDNRYDNDDYHQYYEPQQREPTAFTEYDRQIKKQFKAMQPKQSCSYDHTDSDNECSTKIGTTNSLKSKLKVTTRLQESSSDNDSDYSNDDRVYSKPKRSHRKQQSDSEDDIKPVKKRQISKKVTIAAPKKVVKKEATKKKQPTSRR